MGMCASQTFLASFFPGVRMHFLANPELFFCFTASRFALLSVVAHPSRSHNSQPVSEDLFPLPVVDQVLESL